MSQEQLVEVRFSIYDATHIGPLRYSPDTTIAMLKERIVSEWPKDKKIVPKTASEVVLICCGKILGNNKTVNECRLPIGDLQNTVITMHAVVQPTMLRGKAGKVEETPKLKLCSCSIM